MLHSVVRAFDQFVSILPECIRAEEFFIAFQHWLHLLKLHFGFLEILRHHIVVEGIFMLFTLKGVTEMCELPDVDCNVIVVNGISDKLVEFIPPVG